MTRAEYEQKYGVKPPAPKAVTQNNAAGGAPTTPGFGTRALNVIQEAGGNVADAIAGDGQYANQTPIRRGFEATAQAFNTIPKLGYEALPEAARGGLSAVGGVVGKGFQALTNKIGDNPELQQFVMNHPKVTQAIEEVAGTASAGGQIAGDILTIQLGAKGLQKGAELGAKGVQKVGQGVSKVGEKVYKSAYTPTADEARLLQANKAKIKFLEKELKKAPQGTAEYTKVANQLKEAKAAKPVLSSDTALRRGVAGTEKQIGVQSNVEKLDIWKNQIEPALKGTKAKITKDELFAKARERVANEVEPARKASMQRALESLDEDYANFSGTDLLKANQIKSSLDKFTPSKIFKGQDVASEVKMLKSDMASAIREKTYASIDDVNMKAAYRDYANLKELEKVGIKALTTAGTKGGFGNFWSTIYDQATTPIKTIGGKVLYRVGDKLEFVGQKGTQTLGQHLENIGAITNLKSVNKEAGFIKNPLAPTVSAAQGPQSTLGQAPLAGSVEQTIEQAGGWAPGARQVFDTALLHGDKAAIIKLLPTVPQAYKATFAQKIMDILSKN